MEAMGAGGWQGLTEGELVRAGNIGADGHPIQQIGRDFNDVLVRGVRSNDVELKMLVLSQPG